MFREWLFVALSAMECILCLASQEDESQESAKGSQGGTAQGSVEPSATLELAQHMKDAVDLGQGSDRGTEDVSAAQQPGAETSSRDGLSGEGAGNGEVLKEDAVQRVPPEQMDQWLEVSTGGTTSIATVRSNSAVESNVVPWAEKLATSLCCAGKNHATSWGPCVTMLDMTVAAAVWQASLLQALHRSVKDAALPLPAGALWAQHVLPARRAEWTLNVRVSSHKKFSKLLQASAWSCFRLHSADLTRASHAFIIGEHVLGPDRQRGLRTCMLGIPSSARED